MSTIRRVSLLAVVLVLFGGSVALARLHRIFTGQRIEVTYTPGLSERARLAFERQSGLADGIQQAPRTWRYFLNRRSRADIQALVSHPLVEQTDHIDRSQFRVVVDRPDLPPSLRQLAQAAWLPWVSGLLAVCAFAALWLSLRDLIPDYRRFRAAMQARGGAMRQASETTTRRLTLAIVGMLTALVLPLGVEGRPDEAGFLHLYEAVSLLAGDHPYRDFFEWGAPLPMFLSAAAQWVVGYRVIGELVLQWALTVGGVLVAFQLGARQGASPLGMLAVLPLALLVTVRAGYHFSKLLAIPLGIWAAWRYLDHPTPRRSAVMGCVIVVAFFFRHDYAIWAGLSAMLAFTLARIIRPETRSLRRVLTDGAACALSAAALALPWLLVVGTSEGLVAYGTARAERFTYSQGAGNDNPYAALLDMHPLQLLEDARRQVPAADSTDMWLAQMTMLVPVLLMVSAVFELWRYRSSPEPRRTVAAQRLVAGIVLAGVCQTLIREWSYFLIVAPLTVALSARFLGTRGRPSSPPHTAARFVGRGVRALIVAVAAVLIALSTYAAYVRSPALVREPLSAVVPQLRGRWTAWTTREPTGNNELFMFLRDCTAASDRLLVTGSTPYYAPYYTHRPMAGGHVDWSLGPRGLRSDADREGQSLALLQRQSVPFVVGRGTDVIEVFRRYPRIREYLLANYAPVDGTSGSILYDTRRDIVRTVGDDRWPCFR